MHDGQNIFDPTTSFLGFDWQVDETADSLMRSEIIAPVIIVAIYNTTYRSDEYAPTETGRNYMEYVVNTIKPLIDNSYRTKSNRLNTATAGASSGGLISFMLLWEHPDVFSKAACLSVPLFIDNIDYISIVDSTCGPQKPISLYFDTGTLGVDSLLQNGIDLMKDMLNRKGYIEHKDFYWYIDKGANHDEQAWARRFWRPLTLFWGTR
jgi:predicted alpha/beta superfamily hydrolase